MFDTAGIEYLIAALYGVGMATIFIFLIFLSYFISRLYQSWKD